MVTLQCLALVSVPAPAPKLQCARLNLGVHAWAFASGCLVHGENQPMHIQDLVKICHSNYSLALHYGTQLLFSTFKGKVNFQACFIVRLDLFIYGGYNIDAPHWPIS